MLKWLGSFILKAYGWHWKAVPALPIKKGVLIGAPHTSNWDFVFAMAALKSMGPPVVYLAKKELFKFPLGLLMRFFGGVPVDRSRRSSMVEAMADKIAETEEILVLIPPEGTRSAVVEWKSGFYYTAHLAGVPIYPAYLDYAKKEAGIGPAYYPTGNYEQDIKEIRAFYAAITPRHPEKFKG